MGAGASGYLTKDADAADLVAAVRVVAASGTYVSPTLAGYLMQTGRKDREHFDLTDRELEVLGLVAEGETDKEISLALFISVSTVRSHLDRIRDKTGARRRVQMAALHETMVQNKKRR
jgi:DNA-binding NarL/FixJ family response regulator